MNHWLTHNYYLFGSSTVNPPYWERPHDFTVEYNDCNDSNFLFFMNLRVWFTWRLMSSTILKNVRYNQSRENWSVNALFTLLISETAFSRVKTASALWNLKISSFKSAFQSAFSRFSMLFWRFLSFFKPKAEFCIKNWYSVSLGERKKRYKVCVISIFIKCFVFFRIHRGCIHIKMRILHQFSGNRRW